MTLQQAFELALRHEQSAQFAYAEDIYRQILEAQPGLPLALLLLGHLKLKSGDLDQAIDLYRRTIASEPSNPSAHNGLAVAMLRKGDLEQAIAACKTAMALEPQSPEPRYNLGLALKRCGQIDQAMEVFRETIALAPDFPPAHCDLGNALRDLGRFDESIAEYRKAIELSPDFAAAHHNLGQVLLLTGDYQNGWNENEWRWRIPELKLFEQQFPHPQWHGSNLEGKRILIRAEQGFGDAIQFARYVPLVAQRGGKVIFACREPLVRLMRSLEGVETLVTQGDPFVPFEVQTTLMSLPRLFGTTPSTIPANFPYLRADGELSSRWRKQLDQSTAKMKVGLAWGGKPDATMPQRWTRLEMLAPLWSMEGVTLFSLQKGSAGEEARNLPNLVDWTEQLTDFAETAALIQNLDLVITVDTVIAHLAGALGKPVWVLVPTAPDWRWMLERADSPWYPTARLFRQNVRGDWSRPIAEVVEALKQLRGE